MTDIVTPASIAPVMKCKSVLIVEDDRDIREALEDLLKSEGYNAYSAVNGKDGLEALKTIPGPCLILLDLMMPVMNGWEFMEAKKHDVVLATLPVVIVSALRSASALGNSNFPTAPAGYLKKPVSMDSLLELVQQHCELKSE